jgi:hypothetical protein
MLRRCKTKKGVKFSNVWLYDLHLAKTYKTILINPLHKVTVGSTALLMTYATERSNDEIISKKVSKVDI